VARNIGKTRQTLAGTGKGELTMEAVDDQRLAALNAAVLAIAGGEIAAGGGTESLDDGAAEHVAQR
jgi:hypothetical protein